VETVLLVKLVTTQVHRPEVSQEVVPLVEVVEEVDHAIAAACPVPLDQEVLPVNPADPESQERPVCQETQESHQVSHASQSLPHHASPALADHRAHLAQQDHPEMQEHPDSPVNQDKTHHQASLAQRDHPAHPDNLDSPDNLESLAHQLKANPQCLESQEHPEMLDHLAHLEDPDSPEAMADPAQPDQKDHPAHQVNPEAMDSPAVQVKLDHPEVLARRESAPSTAPSTVVSSSRTELADVKHRMLAAYESHDLLLKSSTKITFVFALLTSYVFGHSFVCTGL